MKTIETKIRQIVANALYLDVSEVSLESNLIRDLGAESIDLLDIIFRIEKEFSIKLPRGYFERRSRGLLNEEEFAINGVLTTKAMAEVRKNIPELSEEYLEAGFLQRDLASLFTVASFVRIIEEHLPPLAECSRPHIPDIGPIVARRGMIVPVVTAGIQNL